MNTYKIVTEDGVVRFGQKDQDDPRSFNLGYHGIYFTEESFEIEDIEGGFTARLIASGEVDPAMYTVTEISIEDVSIAFERSHRTFGSVEELDAFMTKKALQEDSYVPVVRSSESISVILDEQDSPVALIKEAGDVTFIREDADWVEVTSEEEHPEIFGEVVHIDEDDTTNALASWDHSQNSGDSLDTIFKYVEA